jgi:hypothetical protein
MTISPPPRNVMARAGSVLGLIALIFALILILLGTWVAFGQAPGLVLLIGLIIEWIPGLLSILGIVFSAIGLRRARSAGEKPLAARGLVLSIIAFVMPIIALVVISAVGGVWGELWGQPA